MSRLIGRVAALTRFPVKSMAGELLETADLYWSGISGDRRYAFCRTENESPFPWLTGREVPALVLHRPWYEDPADLKRSPVRVALPGGGTVGLRDAALAAGLAEAAGEAVHLLQVSRGLYDAMPVSLASTATFRTLEAAHGAALDPTRFRINVIIESDEDHATWQGKQLAFGRDGGAVLVNDAIPRCVMITIDPVSAARDASVMRTVAQRFGNRFGQYGATARPGPISVGDEVWSS